MCSVLEKMENKKTPNVTLATEKDGTCAYSKWESKKTQDINGW